MIYLDHHATTPVDPQVLEAMLPYFCEKYGNAASVNHAIGWEAAEAVETAREQVAAALGSDARGVVFTSGATESNNLAIKGVLRAAGPGSHLVTTAAEHRSVLDPADRMKRSGYEVTILPVNEFGSAEPQQVADALRPTTALVSIMWANNEVGTISNIAAIGAVCRERGVLFHTDAAQALATLPIEAAEAPVDLVSISAHKVYGPKGVGALFVRRGGRRVAIEPLIDGGGHERHLRSGTLPVPLLVGFGAACSLLSRRRDEDRERMGTLRDRLWERLVSELGNVHLNGHPDQRLANNLNVSFEGVDGEALMNGLKGIAVSSGSACTTADPEPSHVLRAIGRNDQLTRASLRFGIGRGTTAEDIDAAGAEVVDLVRRLRALRAR